MTARAPRHLLSLLDLEPAEIEHIFARAATLKSMQRSHAAHPTLAGRVLAIIFEKSSTRTRVSFEAGIAQMGGSALFLSPGDTHLGRGEPIEDTARVVSRMVDLVAVRTFDQQKLERFAKFSRVPVINALTDRFHPCQILADVFTFQEQRGDIAGRKVAFVGDGNNVCHSFINAARLLGFELRIATPKAYAPMASIVAAAGVGVSVGSDPVSAVEGADLVVTDVWTSMGQEHERARRLEAFSAFQINDALLEHASRDALVMHCLPAHRGEEITTSVLEGPHSVVWDEAENRMHVQKALMEFLVHG